MGKVYDEPGQRWHLPALPTTLARLLLRSQASRKEKRPHPASTPNPPLRLRHLAPISWGSLDLWIVGYVVTKSISYILLTFM